MDLSAEHFKSQVAKVVFDAAAASLPNQTTRALESRVMEWLHTNSPKQILRLALRVDALIVPTMSPNALLRISQMISTNMPQILQFMPNLNGKVQALSKAVRLSRFLHPSALDRIFMALSKEGLIGGLMEQGLGAEAGSSGSGAAATTSGGG